MAKHIEYEIQYLKGVGPRRAEVFAEEGIKTFNDLAVYFPRTYIDRSSMSSIAALAKILKNDNEENLRNVKFNEISFKKEYSILGKVINKKLTEINRFKKILNIIISDGSGVNCKIVFFNRADYFDKAVEIGNYLVVSGYPENDKFFEVNFVHPELEIIDESEQELYQKGAILPKYKLPDGFVKAGINQRLLRKIFRDLISSKKIILDETLPESLLQELKLPGVEECCQILHFPDNFQILEAARYRIKFEESLLFQLSLISLRKIQEITETGLIIEKNTENVKRFYKNLPFQLTQGQINALKDIFADFASGKPMNRLLQGDVGSGKTIVSMIAILAVVDMGYQVAFMAPTELLAEQHLHTFEKFFEGYNINIVQLVGGQKKKLRDEVKVSIVSGEAQIICGTHALFQSDINFNKLGFVIIDEQHRFGVSQRAELIAMAKKSHFTADIMPHSLVMSATPIPRTLTMTAYGDLDVTVIKERPKNRKAILTKVVYEQNRDKVNDYIKSEINSGRQCYFVYPLVEKSEKMELKAATEYYEELKEGIFRDYRVGLLHGQMLWYEKEVAMREFLDKNFDILIATTVIEVGIDIPNATIMVIEEADRFGLAQLHQLRGRVGRGEHQSTCFLFTKNHFQYHMKSAKIDLQDRKAAIIRLKAMEETTDGFKISEIDLKLRGPGDVLGTRQAGMPHFKYIDLITDADIISFGRKIAQNLLKDDPKLNKVENIPLKRAVKAYINSGKEFFGIA
ncbi:MAG: ATP-dependent DNA helicase RecG [Ignavibacteria bacterium GWF2_33_9]|nr:MAG: ATP-dependent DNA helicase RecG [Ignavibacteria bacterium GWF2_33_9]